MPRTSFMSPSNQKRGVIDRLFQALCTIIAVSVVYRYCWPDVQDPYKCGALLNKGHWLDLGPSWSSKSTFQNWQPPGCILHEYKKKEIQQCFGKRKIVFIGDSTTRQVFWAVAKKMDHKRAEEEFAEMLQVNEKHHDLEFTSAEVTVHFIWDPFLNSTRLKRELNDFRPDSPLYSNEVDQSAGLILLGAPGLWYARYGGENLQKDFRDSIETVIPYMDHAIEHSPRLPVARPIPFRNYSPNLLLLAPVQVPWYQNMSPSRVETITPEKIDLMNDYLQQVSAYSNADVIWSYSLMTDAGQSVYEKSGLHVIDDVAHRKADILLNLRCNAEDASKGYPFSRTCCSNYKQPVTVQWIMLLSGMLILPVLPFLRRRYFLQLSRSLPSPSVLTALVTFGLVTCYCFYADRTQIFEKEQKQFWEKEFSNACLVVTFAGLVSIRENKSLEMDFKTAAPKIKDQDFLPRDQTDEWKGWMQFALLIYHYTHGSKILWIYQIVRLLVASYLFMTGFGHTLYFIKREDYSLRRVASVLIRLNLFSCILPYMMRTDFAFYYFTPLVSFWFLNIYFTLKIWRTRNSDLSFLFKKIIVSGLLTTALITIPGILDLISLFLKITCAISWEMEEVRFRISLDMYIVYVGMLLAALHHQKTRLYSGAALPTQFLDNALALVVRYHRTYKVILIISSITLLPSFSAFTRRFSDKQDYNWWHPYISFIPILCFITLRNSHRFLRNYHSVIFAWMGRCSLETYVLQYHIWLAGDAAGILRMGVWSRWTETAILTPVFIWVSWKMMVATQIVTSWIVEIGHPSQSLVQEGGAGSKERPNLLPSTRDGGNAQDKENANETGKSSIERLMTWGLSRVKEDLRWRLGIILAVLWIGNVTYS